MEEITVEQPIKRKCVDCGKHLPRKSGPRRTRCQSCCGRYSIKFAIRAQRNYKRIVKYMEQYHPTILREIKGVLNIE